jgi:transposase-like protein
MRYPASEKLEIIRIVEQSHLPAKRTLDKLGIARRTFYRWYDRFLEGGRRRWKIGHRHRAGCGTASATTSRTRSSNWRWSSPS